MKSRPLDEIISFIEERLSEFSAPRGDEESFRLLDETRDQDLAHAEEEFFSTILRREVQSNPAQRLLLFDVGGSPRLAPRLLAALPVETSVCYVRLDPNPASLALSRSLVKAPARLLLVDPARASLGDSDWAYIKQSVDACVILAAGCSWNAFLSEQQRFVERFFQRATLALASFLLPERVAFIQARLRAVQSRGALFDTISVRPALQREEGLVFQDELSWPLSSEAPALPDADLYQLAVSLRQNPSFPLVNLFSLDYLQREVFAEFRMQRGPVAGEGQLFSLRFTH